MFIYVGGEGAGQQLLTLPLLLLPQVPALLEVPQGCLQVLHVVFQLIHSPAKDQQHKTLCFSGAFRTSKGASEINSGEKRGTMGSTSPEDAGRPELS